MWRHYTYNPWKEVSESVFQEVAWEFIKMGTVVFSQLLQSAGIYSYWSYWRNALACSIRGEPELLSTMVTRSV